MADEKTPDDDKVVSIKTAPKKKPAKKKVVKKKPPSARALHAAATAKVIFAKTKQKPVAQNFSTHPFVPSGSSMVDDLIGGTPAQDGKGPVCPGYPRRRITEIYGPESSGKTTLALEAIKEVQKAGGWCMFLDFEHALHHGYAKSIGVNFSAEQLLLYAPDTFEEGLRMMFMGILGGCDLIVVDSVAAMVPKKELEKPIGDAAKIGALASELSNKLPKVGVWLGRKNPKNKLGSAVIFINQTRTGGIGTQGGAKENTAGGKALKFYAYLRLRLVRIRTDSVERKNPFTGKVQKYPYGNRTQVKVVKSKIDAKQNHTTDIFIRYGKGVDDYLSILEAAVANKLMKREGAWYTYGDIRFQGREKMRDFLAGNFKVFSQLRAQVLQKVQESAIDAPPAVEDDDANLMSQFDSEFGDDDGEDDEDEIKAALDATIEGEDIEL